MQKEKKTQIRYALGIKKTETGSIVEIRSFVNDKMFQHFQFPPEHGPSLIAMMAQGILDSGKSEMKSPIQKPNQDQVLKLIQ